MIERIIGIGGTTFLYLYFLRSGIGKLRETSFYLCLFGDAVAYLVVTIFVCKLTAVLCNNLFYETVQLVIPIGGLCFSGSICFCDRQPLPGFSKSIAVLCQSDTLGIGDPFLF